MKKKKKYPDYHKKRLLNLRLDDEGDRARLDDYARKHKVSVSWIVKRGLELFWQAAEKGQD